MANLVQSDKGHLTIGTDAYGTTAPAVKGDLIGAVSVVNTYNVPGPFQTVYTATRPGRVMALTVRVDVAGTDASAVTAAVWRTASGTAPASGVALHTGTFNLKGTVNTNQVLTLSTTDSDLLVAPGDSIIVVFTGTTTLARGAVTVDLAWR